MLAGAAITTFMALIKAIAAQIASSKEPLRMQFYLICTFRTRSELHAYGSFLHQITRDPRFTTWLHVEVYVSRPDKAKTLMGAHAHVIKNDIQVPGQSLTKKQQKRKRFQSLRRTGTMLKRALSGRTVTEGMPPPITVISGLNKESKPVDQSANGKATSSASNGDVATDQSNVSLTDVESHTHSESTDKPTAGNNNENKRQSERCDSSSVSSSTPVSLVCSPVSTKFDESAISEKMRIEEDFRANGTAFTSSSPTCAMTYDSKRLPTFHDAQSNSVSTRLAKLDLHVTAIMVCIPLGFWFILRAIKWEGPEHYCNVRAKMTATQYKICYGFYSVAPVFGHAVLVSIIGYFAVWYARKVLIKSLNASNLKDIETGKHFVKNPNTNEASASASADLPYPKFELEDEDLSVEDGNWDEGDVVYSVGRMNVKVVIDRFMEKGVGLAGKDRGLITVFGGGPEAFVEHVERQILRAKWAVDFHRETWAP
ncbi:hypothetical protein BX616_004315 [Lobosporangium transversale]|nr:hypothetical protein BX616_004315 [Lobosporangium transversale]